MEAPQSPNVIDISLLDINTDELPGIHLVPSRKNYEARVERLSKNHPSPIMSLPPGFPQKIETQRAWVGSEFRDETKYMCIISGAEIEEIELALFHFQQTNTLYEKYEDGNTLPNAFFNQISKETFPLPTLGRKLKEISKELHFGCGFTILRGLDPKKYTSLQNLIIVTGMTSYIAEKRGCQDQYGSMVVHVKDLGDDIAPPNERQSLYANSAQPFHTDICDILALYVLGKASEGGESKLASTAAVYNQIAATRPDVIKVLADESWVFEKHNENQEIAQKPRWHNCPLLFNEESQGPFFCFSRRALTGSLASPRPLDFPEITERQAEALDMVHFTALENSISISLKPGDIQLLNNFALFHSREAFIDKPEQKRHILRLWLRNEIYAWKTPGCLVGAWDIIYGDSKRREKAHWRVDPSTIEREQVVRIYTCG